MSPNDDRTAAQFFFECGYGAAFADGYIENGNKPAFTLSDSAIERAWAIAPDACGDYEEWSRYLAMTLPAAATAAECQDPKCFHCGDSGEIFGHADDCNNDSCALNGDIDSCLGKVEPCGCAARQAPATGEPDRELAGLIKTRLLGVDPMDQDLQLEDDDWRRIIAALNPADTEEGVVDPRWTALMNAQATIAKLEAEIQRRDANELRNCINWGPCSQSDASMREDGA